MNKVININFQGRVIPIEEPAYEELKKYTESLRIYFANEEGREEIINDIENRIAELFSEKLKATGTNFISEAHVAAIISSIGRPEQFEELSMDESSQQTKKEGQQERTYTHSAQQTRGSLYRNENDKILGGVCSGIGAYLKIDTSLVRVLFALLAVGAFGTGLVLYIILWAILPSRYLSPTAVTRKLYRDAEQKVIGGVCSGIAHYFNIAVWIPRLIFVVPLVVGILKLPLTILFVPFAASFSGTMFVIYIILWIVVPKAVTASERLEMKGQRVDLETIKHKVQDEIQGVKKNVSENATAWKNNFETKVNEWGKEVDETARNFSGQAGPAAKRSGNAFVRFVVGLFKVFIFFILGIISISLVAALIGLIAGANVLMPLGNFLADGDAIKWYALGTLVLFIFVPIIAVVQWLIRSIIGHRSKSPVIGVTLGIILWALGWVCITMLVATVSKQFKRPGSIQQEMTLVQPANGKLKIDFRQPEGNYYPLDLDWDSDFDFRRDTDGILLSRNEDSLLLSNIRVKLEKSRDDQFHVTVIRRARAESPAVAEGFAEKINYIITQQDSVLSLPLAFPITTATRFRNQQVIVEIQVPVGKEIYIDEKADQLSWYSVRSGTRGLNINIDHDYDDEDSWRTGVWYIMKESGIEKKYKDEVTREESMEQLEKSIREMIREENMKVEELKIDIKPNGDTTIDVSVKDIVMAEAPDLKNTSAGSVVKPVSKIFFGAFKLLKMGY